MDFFEEELEELQEEAVECAVSEPIPMKSKKLYCALYDKFISWCFKQNISQYTEDVLLTYFYEESKKVKSSTLWAHYSMLKSTLALNKGIDISLFRKLIAFLKRQNDGYTPKKSKIFKREELEAFFNGAPDSQYLFMKAVAIMGIAGACRRYEFANITIDDIHDVGSAIIVTIPDTGTCMERCFTIKDNGNTRYVQILRKYMNLRPYCDHRRLFVNYIGGKCTKQPVGVNKFGRIPSEIASYLKLPDALDYTGDSFRRTSATLLVNPRGSNANSKNQNGWNSATLTEGHGENSIQAKLGIARNVLGLRWGKDAEISRTSEIAACSSKTSKLQTISDIRREPSTSYEPDLSKNWNAHSRQINIDNIVPKTTNINQAESYEQYDTKPLKESASRDNVARTENEAVGRHNSENEHRLWEQNDSEQDFGDSNSPSGVMDMNLSVILPHELSSSKNVTQNLDTNDSNLQKTYGKSIRSVLQNTNVRNTDQCTSNNEPDNTVPSSSRTSSSETILTDNIRDIEMVLIRLQGEKLLLELDKLKLQRDKMKAEKRNIHLRNNVLCLQKQLISIEASDRVQTSVMLNSKTYNNINNNNNLDTLSSTLDIVNTRDCCVSTVHTNDKVVAEENSDSDIEIDYISMNVNQHDVKHSNILCSDKKIVDNVRNLPKFKTANLVEKPKQASSSSVSAIDGLSSGITKETSQKIYSHNASSQKTYLSKSVLANNRAQRPITGSAIKSSECFETEIPHSHYSDSSKELRRNSQEINITCDEDPMRVNELEEIAEHKYDTASYKISATDRCKGKDVQKLSPLNRHEETNLTDSVDLQENGGDNGANSITHNKRKRETTRIYETLQVHPKVETQFAFIEVKETNLDLEKETYLDLDSGNVGNDLLVGMVETRGSHNLEGTGTLRKSFTEGQQSSIKRTLDDTDNANGYKKVKHKNISF